MARQSSRRSAPARSAPPPAPRPSAQVPAQAAPAQPPMVPQQAQPQQPGMFAQMATTAAGVAVGSAVGHTIGAGLTGLFSGGSREPAPQQQQQAAPVQQSQYNGQSVCEPDSRAFQACLDKNPTDINACQFYLDMWKQCQANNRQWA